MKARKTKQPVAGSFAAMMARSRLRAGYWLERIDLCETRAELCALARQIAMLAKGAAAADSQKPSTARKTAFACSALVVELREFATECASAAQCLEGEVKRGECIRQSAESKSARAEVLRSHERWALETLKLHNAAISDTPTETSRKETK